MSELTISSTGWLAISLRNGAACAFSLTDANSWQFLQSKDTTDNVVKEKQTNEDGGDEEDIVNLNRNLIRFTPNGQTLIVNGQNKQLFVYTLSNLDKNQISWHLQRTINVRKRVSALDLTDDLLLIADKTGDVYKVDLSTDDQESDINMKADDCIMGHLSMLLDITFIQMTEKKQFILTADRDEKIRLSNYPNAYNIEGYCLGHTEFVSHIKVIDNIHFLSASGDGTLRLWQLPDCIPLAVLHSSAFTLSSKSVFYTDLYDSQSGKSNEDYQASAMFAESTLDSSPVNHAIWKMDIASCLSNVFIAFSLYAHRAHAIYLTTLTNMQQLSNTERKLILDSNYGAIIDYCFSSRQTILNEYSSNSICYLYILFDTNKVIKVNIMAILSSDKTEIFGQIDKTIEMINSSLSTNKEMILLNTTSNDAIFKQLFKARSTPGTNSYYKRKTERIEQQQQRKKKRMPSESDNELPV